MSKLHLFPQLDHMVMCLDGKQWQLKGVLSYYKMGVIAGSALHFEIVGMEKHIITLLYGPMIAEQKSTVKQKSSI